MTTKKAKAKTKTKASKVIPKDKSVAYTYLTNNNVKFLKKLATKSGQSVSFCLDAILDKVRVEGGIDIEEKIPKYVLQARAYEKRKKEKTI